MVKKVVILGSTGSIGRNALRVIEALNSSGDNGFEVLGLSANVNASSLAEQAKKFRPRFIAIKNQDKEKELRELVKGLDVEVLSGAGSLEEIASLDEADIILTAVVGATGLGAVLAAAEKGKRLAIANKEPLVVAGEMLMKAAKESGAEVLPVDSEHSAIFQALEAGRREDVERVILTGSGGPFRGMGAEELEKVSKEEALAHPTWNMGPKITVDSATLMNKALEVIEARWLFGLDVEKIQVLIHPESIIHSMVEFVDGSVIAQMGRPDMCLPIQYALTYPARVPGISEHLQLEEIGRLTFEKPDLEVFRALALGFDVAKAGGTAAAVFNAANEAAVEAFLAGHIEFYRIVELIEHCLDKHNRKASLSLDELLEADAWARNEVAECLNQRI
ncbi:MAG: 1-deoxy-D-xylulose-5-phosphate reductoisomerase [Planctomycetota bacterium]|jgi:1-deoxy-D-xylulose-5-phosphate reductoisomerase